MTTKIKAGVIGDGVVGTTQIADDAVTSAKLDTNIAVAGTLTVTGDITGTLATAAQTNITSLGTLTGLTVNSGATNTVANFTSTDIGAYLNVTDQFQTGRLNATGSVFKIEADPDNTYASTALAFTTDGTEHMRIDSSGNVGIGTANPSATLDVIGGGSGNVASFKSGAANINDYAGITIHSQTVTNVDWYGSEIRSINTASTPSSLNPRLGFFTQDNNTYLPADRTEKMSILGNGNVGIGINNPSVELHVYSADQNALKIQTNTAINQIELANSTNSPTYITANSYALELKADDNGWGGTASAIKFNVKATERMRIDSAGVVHAKAGLGAAPITSCSGFTGTAGYEYLIKPVGALEPFWAVYSGDNYKSRGKGYFRWWYGYGEAATGTNYGRCEVDLVDKNLEFYEVIVEDMAGTTYQASAPAYEWAYWSTRQKFNTQSSNTNYATSSSMSGNIEAMWGQAGGHGLYRDVIGNVCSWGALQPADAIGAGYTGNCGTYPTTLKGVPEPHYTDCSLRLGRPIISSASFTQTTGAFSYWFNF